MPLGFNLGSPFTAFVHHFTYMTPFKLQALNPSSCQLLDAHGQHVGNLKLINGSWKFKAIGYGPHGELIPGGGPLTDRHNTTFVRLDAAEIGAGLVGA